ncbi:hypothetical protein [Brevundimonas sp.]|uniref:hypothetical protein n=1 Tax=Brevundimonas sp. TaxID=1871086 RepID=UPI0028A78795|nr:hypothetical protein [Brevundimonas sp.]
MLIVAALSLALQLPERPAALVLPGEEEAYMSFLKGEAVVAAELLSGRKCEAFDIVNTSSRSITVNGGSTPAANERVILEGCGIRHVQNVEVARFGAEPEWQARLGVVGESLTNNWIQSQFIPDMFGYARLNTNIKCDDSFLVLDTYVAANPGNVEFPIERYSPADPGQPWIKYDGLVSEISEGADLTQSWAEVWNLRICDQNITTLIIFIPMQNGKFSQKYLDISSISALDKPKRAIPIF